MIYVESKRKSLATIRAKHPSAVIIDVTSRGEEPWVRVSPFYPHGGIPVPFSESVFSASVEGVWQGLKVFEGEDVDVSKFTNEAMKGIKRTVRKLGKPRGHRMGVYGTELLDYGTARKKIYLATYRWMLINKAADVIEELCQLAEASDVVLLDYDTNGDITNLKSPVSHAALVKMYIEWKHPHLKEVKLGSPDSYKPTDKPSVTKAPKKSTITNQQSKPQTLPKGKGKGKPGQLPIF